MSYRPRWNPYDRWDPYDRVDVPSPEPTPEEIEAERLYWIEEMARQHARSEEGRRQREARQAYQNCPTCRGTGRVNVGIEWATARNGHDRTVSDPCPLCEGSGHVEPCGECGDLGPTAICGSCRALAMACSEDYEEVGA